MRPRFTPAAGTWLAAGNRFTKRRIVPPVPLGAYTGRITGVPLTGGQASGTIGGITGSTGSDTAPPASTGLTGSFIIPPAGTYTVNWSVQLSGGTPGSGDAANFELVYGATVLAVSTNPGAAGTYQQAPVTFTANGSDGIYIGTAGNDGTSGVTYTGIISPASAPLTLTAGPQGLGAAWYPAQVTLSTSTGVLDTSTAQVYLGIGGVPTALVASVFSGNGTAAVAIPSMQPGEFIIVTWINGHVGDTASFNVIGTMDALTTGPGR